MNAALKVLYVTPYVPSPIRVRPYHLIRSLTRLGHNVTLLCAAQAGPEDEEQADELRSWGVETECFPVPLSRTVWNCALALPTREPMQAVFSYSPEMARRLHELCRSGGFDVVHIEHLRAARHVRATGGMPTLLDAVDCISLLFEQASSATSQLKSRLMTRFELARTRRYEAELLTKFGCTIVTSPRDKTALEELADRYLPPDSQAADLPGLSSSSSDEPRLRADVAGSPSEVAGSPSEVAGSRSDGGRESPPGDGTARSRHPAAARARREQPSRAPIHVVANGVDLEYFRPSEDNQQRDRRTIVFSGKMSYHANVTAARFFATKVMPLLWERNSDLRFRIVGKDPPKAIQALSADARVEVTGTVADLRPHLGEAAVSVCPVPYSVGIQNKVLEAMAMGTPVVCSPAALTALQAHDGGTVLTADDPHEFAAQTLRVLSDPVIAADIRAAGRSYVEEWHSWDSSARKLVDCYEEARRRPRPRTEQPNSA